MKTIESTELHVIENGEKIIIRPEHFGTCYTQELKNKPAKILKKLLEKPNQLVSYPEVVSGIWDVEEEDLRGTIRCLDVHLVTIKNFLKHCDLDYQVLRANMRGVILVTIDKYDY